MLIMISDRRKIQVPSGNMAPFSADEIGGTWKGKLWCPGNVNYDFRSEENPSSVRKYGPFFRR
jgi:hypothetical protein